MSIKAGGVIIDLKKLMQENTRLFLLDVTKKLMENRITGKYRQFSHGSKQIFAMLLVNPTTETQLDLLNIKDKLNNKKYQSYDEWRADINKVFAKPLPSSYADKEKMKPYRKLANEFVLERLLKEGNVLTTSEWANKIVKLRRKMQGILDEPPLNIQQFVPSLCNIKAISQLKVLSQQDIDAFMKAAEMCYSEEHHRNMIDIIKEEEPSLDWKTKEFRFDINRLRLGTVYRLMDYMKRALEKEGKQYPNVENSNL